MIVAPSPRGRGIGSEMLSRLERITRDAGIRDMLLFSAAGVVSFFEKGGFVRRREEAPGMVKRLVE